jgi:uncharacterized protein DUF6572
LSDFGKAEDGEDATVALDDPSVIDFVTQAPDGDVVLVMVEGRTWDGSTERLQELRDNINAYIEFVVDGQSRIPETFSYR